MTSYQDRKKFNGRKFEKIVKLFDVCQLQKFQFVFQVYLGVLINNYMKMLVTVDRMKFRIYENTGVFTA